MFENQQLSPFPSVLIKVKNDIMTDQVQDLEIDIDISRVERDAKDTVSEITKCINIIRNVEAFQPVLMKNVLTNNAKTVQNQKRLQLVNLFKILNDQLSMEGAEGLWKELRDEKDSLLSRFLKSSKYMIADTNYHPMEHHRYRLVYEILLPLLDRLGNLFKILDEQQEISTKHDSGQDGIKTSEFDRTKSKSKKKPNAPRGLLSLLNYTDIACLLELTVCTSILPLLEKNVQSHIIERSKKLPKSLAGRLHRKSLHWGMESLQYKVNPPAKKQDEKRNMMRQRAAVKIDKASKELSDVIITVSRVLLLDRFRPMLLPRHATDIYSALFQLDRLASIRKNFEFPVIGAFRLERNDLDLNMIRQIFLACDIGDTESPDGSGVGNDGRKFNTKMNPIDLNTMVKSYQILLLSGKQAPSWLKMRLSRGLSNLAASSPSGLEAIIEVFVLAAASLPTGQMTAASSRLGRALCTKVVSTSDNAFQGGDSWTYYRALFCHFLKLMNTNEGDFSGAGMDSSNTALVLTIWAVLENLPKEITHPLFFRPLIAALYPSLNNYVEPMGSIQSSIRRIYSLLFLPPIGCKAIEELCLFLCTEVGLQNALSFVADEKVHAPGSTSPLSQLVRIATSGRDKVVSSNIAEEAARTINLIVFITLHKWNHDDISGEKFLAVSLLMSVPANPFDSFGYSFHHSVVEGGGSVSVTLEKGKDLPTNDSLLNQCEKRTFFLVNQITLGLDFKPFDQDGKDAVERMQCLVGEIFRLQLMIYFAALSPDSEDSLSYLPGALGKHLHQFKIISMLLLPVLCENCPPEALLMDRRAGQNGILNIIHLILMSTSVYLKDESGVDTAVPSSSKSAHSICDFSKYDKVFRNLGANTEPSSTSKLVTDISVDLESHLSITSIAISILLAILELGSNHRTVPEEDAIKSLIPHLNSLSKLENLTQKAGSVSTSVSTLRAEIADMSVHSVALIQARSLEDLTEEVTMSPEDSLYDYIEAKVAEIETQISSDQPPLRAHGIVQLRKLAQKTLTRDISESTSTQNKALIIDISDTRSPNIDTQNNALALVEQMLRICVLSLKDHESYVYLAGIQTIVAIADENPNHFFPVIVNAFVSGKLTCNLGTAGTSELTSEQRVKISEALNFIIRRRGSAIINYASSTINAILYGNDIGISPTEDAIQKIIQVETESYFKGNESEAVDDIAENDVIREYHQEMYSKLRTGGPVFKSEEEDVIRAACVSILAELVSSLTPSSVATHCTSLVVLSTTALQLDHSRLVRRAAAMLCRELYYCALREVEIETRNEAHDKGIPFILSLVSSGEGAIRVALRRSAAADDLDILIDNGSKKAVSDKSRLFDSATAVRCEEALEAYQELEASGFLRAGLTLLKAQHQRERSPLARFLSREFHRNDEIVGADFQMSG